MYKNYCVLLSVVFYSLLYSVDATDTTIEAADNNYYTFTDSLVTSNHFPHDSDWELCESTLYRVLWSSWVDGGYSGGQVNYSGFTMTSDSTMYLQNNGECYGSTLASYYDTYDECLNAGYLWDGCSRIYYTGTPTE